MPDPVFPFRFKEPAPALGGTISFLTSHYNVKLLNSAYNFKVQLFLHVPDPVFPCRFKGPAPALSGTNSCLISYYAVVILTFFSPQILS